MADMSEFVLGGLGSQRVRLTSGPCDGQAYGDVPLCPDGNCTPSRNYASKVTESLNSDTKLAKFIERLRHALYVHGREIA
jgi:hypothetical protein